MISYIIPHVTPPTNMGVTTVQSTAPVTADQPSMAPQLKAIPEVRRINEHQANENKRDVQGSVGFEF